MDGTSTGATIRTSLDDEATYARVRATTIALAAPLSVEEQCAQSMPDASPTKWHLAHTTWFFERFVLAALDGAHRLDPAHDYLFNSYYEAVGPRQPRAARDRITRPTLAEVLAHRARIDEALAPWLRRPLPPAIRARVALGLEHERQHQELLLTDALHLLASSPLRSAYRTGTAVDSPEPPPVRWIERGEGLASFGHRGEGFAFDNELPRHRRFLEAFALASRPVTNGEFLAFVEAGGYRDPAPWLSDGWAAVQAQGWTAPLYWTCRDGAWSRFGLRGARPLDRSAPVAHVSFYEADAFARWSGARLPTEFEWELLADGAPRRGNLLESERLEPSPLRIERGDEAGDEIPHQMFGDVWEWTAGAYEPYPRYRPAEGALGEYNGKFMCSQLVLRGGSCFTPAASARPTYRNFFPPAARWQASGVRLARWL